MAGREWYEPLYLIEILHQTTTSGDRTCRPAWLYLIEILHQTTTEIKVDLDADGLYLIEILHQTTTYGRQRVPQKCCILSKFYIKPQQFAPNCHAETVVSYRNSTSNHNDNLHTYHRESVVSYRNSTSNHNFLFDDFCAIALYLIEILHQTTTLRAVVAARPQLYLIEILHQTTTLLAVF